MSLKPDVMLSVEISCVMSRNKYTSDPAPVIEELYSTAGDRVDLLTREVGSWVGFYEDDYTQVLTAALREIPGIEPWITLGQSRRGSGHSTQDYARPPGVS